MDFSKKSKGTGDRNCLDVVLLFSCFIHRPAWPDCAPQRRLLIYYYYFCLFGDDNATTPAKNVLYFT